MDLPKVCRDVRGAPYVCRRAAPARLSAVGVVAVEHHTAASSPGTESNPHRTRPAIAVHLAQATLRASPGRQAQHMDVKVACNRTLPFHRCGKRASWRTGRQRPVSARCCDANRPFSFLHGSRPIPFHNARVEVGPSVMED